MNRLLSIIIFHMLVLVFCSCKNKIEYSDKPPYSPLYTNQSILQVNESKSDSLDITSYLQAFYGKSSTQQKKQWQDYSDSSFKELSNSVEICWLKLTIHSSAPSGYKGLLSFTNLDKVLVYDSSGKIEKAGQLVPLKEWSYPTDNHCITITINGFQTKTYFIGCYKQGSAIEHPVKFLLRSEQNENNFQLYEIRNRMIDTVFLFFYLGFLFFCFTYFFIQSFYSSNKKLLRTYSLYILFTLLYSFRDIDKHYFLQTSFPVFNGIYIWFEGMFSYLSYIFYMLFVVNLLDLNNKSKWAYRLIMFVIGVLLILLMMDIVMRLVGNGEIALSVFKEARMLLFPFVFLYFILLIPLRKKFDEGNSYYTYFIIGSVFLVVGTGINLLVILIRDSQSFFLHDTISSKYGFYGNTVNYTRLGIIIEIVFFSLGLSKKMKLDYSDAVISEESAIDNWYFAHEIQSALISLKSRLGPQEDAKKYLKLFRDYLNKTLILMKYKRGIELSEEINMIISYFNLRREDDETYEFIFKNEMNIKMETIIVPAALLIPFVQNFFDHAAVENNNTNILIVTVYEKNSRVNLDLSDNGRGLEKVNEEEKTSSSGLAIARRKIALFNYRLGTKVGFKIKDNETGKGTLITICNLPKRNKHDPSNPFR